MIFDRLDHLRQYGNLPHSIPSAIDYLLRTDFDQVPDGRHELDGARLVAIVQSYRTRPAADARWEAHRRYVDVQYVYRGEEQMGHLLWREGLAIVQPYDTTKDVIFFDASGSLFSMTSGDVAIFLPQDVHAPGLSVGGSASDVRKVVLKCLIG